MWVPGVLVLMAATANNTANAAPQGGVDMSDGQTICVERSMHYEVASEAQVAQVTSISYASTATDSLIESIRTPDGCLIRRSADDGESWEVLERWAEAEPLEGQRYLVRDAPEFFLDPDNGLLLRVFMECESIHGVPPWEPESPVMTTRRLYTQVSADEGRTWGPRQQVIQRGEGYDETHWAQCAWYGRNSLAVEGTHMLKLPDGRVLMPFWGPMLHDNGSMRSPVDGGFTWLSGCFIGTWRADGSGLDWDMGEAITLPRRYSDDGADEPGIDRLPDGRLFMVIRARVHEGSQAEVPGIKFYSLSEDDGLTWQEAKPVLYDDGSYPYSPACLGNVLRSGKNGRFYIITNLNPEPGANCDPRTALQIAQIDPEALCILRDTVTVIEARSGQQPPNIRFSNFRWYEQRGTGDIILYLAACPGDVGRSEGCGVPGHSYRYAIRLPER